VELTHLPQDILDELVPPRPTLSLASVTDLGELLEASDGNITRLAKRLGVSRNTLYKRLKAQGHGLQEE
jgi:transcriptional regulator of acetoin/glycerol metabolism